MDLWFVVEEWSLLVTSRFAPWTAPLELRFDPLHILLLQIFALVLVSTLLFVFVSWKIYGKKISERFMKPATSKAIQELKDSVSRLKLPKEHTPRI